MITLSSVLFLAIYIYIYTLLAKQYFFSRFTEDKFFLNLPGFHPNLRTPCSPPAFIGSQLLMLRQVESTVTRCVFVPQSQI